MGQDNKVTKEELAGYRLFSRIRMVALYVLTAAVVLIAIWGISMISDTMSMAGQAKELKAGLEEMLSSVKAQDIDGANVALAKVDSAADALDETLSSPLWETLQSFPFVGSDISSVHELINLLQDASDGAIKPAISVVVEYPMSGLKVDDGFSASTINAYIGLLKQMEPFVNEVIGRLDNINFVMVKSDKITEYTDKMKMLVQTYADAEQYLNLFDTFLGDGEDRTYLLVAQNSAEIRASGGFPGSIGTIRIEDGILYIGDFASVYNVLSYGTPTDVGPTEQEDSLFGNWMHYPRDAGVNPDFPRVAQIWARSYENYNKEDVDGVVSLTPVIIQQLLSYIGSITLSDGTELNGDNATMVLQHDLYNKYLSAYIPSSQNADMADALFAETAKATMGMLVQDFDVKRLASYFEIFDEGVSDRTIMMWMKNEEDQTVVESVGASGALNSDENKPVAGIYFSGTEASKLGWYFDMDTEVSEPVENGDGTRTYDVTVTMRNTIGDDDISSLGLYILGPSEGTIVGYIHMFAPAGGTVSDFKASQNTRIYMDNYAGLDLGYTTHVIIYPKTPFVVTYKVTTAAGVTEPLQISTTPTLQDYR